MPGPQVSERVKDAPVSALRAMFASIGSLLSITDKFRGKSATSKATATSETTTESKAPASSEADPAPVTTVTETPVAETTITPEETAAPEAVVIPDDTVTPDDAVTLDDITLDDIVAPEPVVTEPAVTEPVAAEPVVTEAVVTEPVAAEPVVTEPVVTEPVAPADTEVPEPAAVSTEAPAAGAALPLANYDELTLPSLRARLRTLSAPQVAELLAYEKGHAGRGDIVTMFERRIAKLEAEA